MKYVNLFAAVCVVLLMAHLALADVVFSDSEFDNADWELTVLMDGPGGTITATQVISGGNPGAYRNVTHVLNAPEGGQRSRVVGLHLPIGASYNPQLEGPIASIDYSQDAIGIEITGAGMRTNPLILQNGNAYLAPGPLVTQPVWTTVSLSGLTEVDFALLRPDLGVDNSVHPDFSESGAPLRLGFASSNSTGSSGSGFTMVAGIDNWSISIAQDELAICEEDLSQCQEDLSDALADPRDEDGDGEADSTDICAGTPLLTEVDSDGCSLEQFCSQIDATTRAGKKTCKKSDWKNDEPVMTRRDRDCAVDKGGPGREDDRCVPVAP